MSRREGSFSREQENSGKLAPLVDELIHIPLDERELTSED